MSKAISPYFVSSGAPPKVSSVTMASVTVDTAVKPTHFIPQNAHVGSSSVGDIHTSWINTPERDKYTPTKSVDKANDVVRYVSVRFLDIGRIDDHHTVYTFFT